MYQVFKPNLALLSISIYIEFRYEVLFLVQLLNTNEMKIKIKIIVDIRTAKTINKEK